MANNARIKLYKNTFINRDKNMEIEHLEQYLDDKVRYDSSIQYIKHALNVTIKLNISETELNFDLSGYDYARVIDYSEATGEKSVYYFIVNKSWKSESCIELTLVMDTINTFKRGVDYVLSDKTFINRQHKNRFKENPTLKYEIQAGSVTSLQTGKIYALIPPEALSLTSPEIESTNGVGGFILFDNDMNVLKEYNTISKPRIVCDNIKKIYFLYSNLGDLLERISFADGITPAFYLMTGTYTTQDTEAKKHANNVITHSLYFRDIDLQSEGVTSTLFGEDKDVLMGDGANYFLIYKTDNDFDPDTPDAFIYNNAVGVYCCADVALEGQTFTNKAEILPSDLTDGVNYLIRTPRYGTGSIYSTTGEGLKISVAETWPESFGAVSHDILIFKKSGSRIEYYVKHYNILGVFLRVKASGTTTKLTFDEDISYSSVSNSTGTYGEIINSVIDTYNKTASGSVTYNVLTIDRINRTDSKLVKIFMLPYKPVEAFNEFVYTTDQLYKLDVNSEGFTNRLSFNPDYNPFKDMAVDINPSLSDTKNIELESKLLHSDYYLPKFIYDSFSFAFCLECATPIIADDLQVDFITSNTCNSRFAFRFPQYDTADKMRQDYNVLTISRNNEIAIFNNYYLNYLRNGYNYDVKNKARSEVATGVGAFTAVASLALGVASNNPALIATGVISTSATLINAVNAISSQEQSLQQKISQLQQQSASVAGSDDVDIMKAITDNKAKLMLYKVSSNMKKALYDLFYYTGYICNYKGLPDTNSRLWWNYIQCEPVFESYKNIPSDLLQNIKDRHVAGVTIYHDVTRASLSAPHNWDINQERENYETLFNL